ncbi:peroxiredoxin Q/BCP [Chitinophaga terrae (ex Kim and Jung 2007)]|jgi:peroxiredoxin Q/BCP|uniref:thioredoxin-dependent peroxiredoxin n=1 Tax=Chitinophaga terrae (ex Kim and Jung 2007) TaxID=408074 RepID=A0A1H3Y0S4_9BACT|nr:thioredoxin-dependent thiol peroxidase [Chitinophaga terrae (ex Kim and Jung 2007)]MDQ0108066.1 peroxiredoxin Q/BCP [Chitinophaga terrae (ex Kim and Jung 2007)]GEP89528.1 peroxiredoxin [Chitinophaga terrae (ex Kim and Jung 2007)]SEA05325.1 peroxiredoxin Q/BCP [Chitinophaga terrae (ex Kim and Jung 2007)]
MTHLQEGDKAPVFKGKDQNGKTVSLTDFKGKRVVLYFYPKDMTPGCTAQACNLRDNYDQLLKLGYVVIGVSTDSEQSHQKFIAKYELPFTLLADEDRKIVNQYGVFGEKQMMGRVYDGVHRTTFLIDEKGKIAHIIKKPDTQNQTEQILELWK